MAGGDKWVRSVMMNPFALGGEIQGGKREEDQDRMLTKVFRDPLAKTWVAPHVYAFFETRVVRRSNMLHNQLVGGPDMGGWYRRPRGNRPSAARSDFSARPPRPSEDPRSTRGAAATPGLVGLSRHLRRGRDPSPRTIRAVAAAPPQPVAAD